MQSDEMFSASPQPGLKLARSELILGGQKSGKSRRAEMLARDWLNQSAGHRAVLIATARPGDPEMRLRIARHRADRAARLPGMETVEEPLALAETLLRYSRADTLVVVDCLTLWLTNWMLPMQSEAAQNPARPAFDGKQQALLLEAVAGASGPVVLVGNEIGLGVIPLGGEVRAFVDALGQLNQEVARVCQRVTLMAAGLPLTLKDTA